MTSIASSLVFFILGVAISLSIFSFLSDFHISEDCIKNYCQFKNYTYSDSNFFFIANEGFLSCKIGFDSLQGKNQYYYLSKEEIGACKK